MNITTEILRNMRLLKVDNGINGRVYDFCFSRDGNWLANTSADDTLKIYECKTGNYRAVFSTKLYGSDRIVFNRNATCCLHSSTKLNHSLHLLSINDYAYVSCYPGHTDKVINLDISPVEDTVVSCSLDKSVRLWDLRVMGHIALVNVLCRPAACFAPRGNMIAIVANNDFLKLLDIRAYQNATLASYALPKQPHEWASIKFSPDGNFLFLSSFGRLVCQINACSGETVHLITERSNPEEELLEACYSPDGNFLISGTANGAICFYHQSNGVLASHLAHESTFPVKRVQFNPQYVMLASSCNGMNFWVPNQCIEDSDGD